MLVLFHSRQRRARESIVFCPLFLLAKSQGVRLAATVLFSEVRECHTFAIPITCENSTELQVMPVIHIAEGAQR